MVKFNKNGEAGWAEELALLSKFRQLEHLNFCSTFFPLEIAQIETN
jgi:hypothetical protein